MRRFAFLLAVLFLLMTGVVSAQNSGCGTVVPQSQIEFELAQIAAGVDYSANKAAPQAAVVPLTIHIIRSSAGMGGLSTADLNQAMSDLDLLYVPMDISFYVCGSIDYIDDDNFYLDMGAAGQIDALRQVNSVFGTINIWFVPGSSGFPYCGISSFTGSAVQGIVMSNNCTAGGSPSTLAHEVGHYFDLYHTHETAFGVECPDGSNCSTTGDLFCDTPADPQLSGHVSPYPDCAYDNAASTPAGCGGTYNPQTDNLMSYSQKPCRDFWSADQIDKAIYTLNNSRTELLSGCTPVIGYLGRWLAETSGDGDDLVEAGEAFDIDVIIRNVGSEALATAGVLLTSDPFLSVTTSFALFDAVIPSGNKAATQTPFGVSVAPGCPDPHVALLNLNITADGGYGTSEQFLLFIGSTPGFADDVESGTGYWSHYAPTIGMVDQWHIDSYRAHSGSSSWKIGGGGAVNYADGTDAALVTQPFLAGDDAGLTFWHWMDAEDDAGMTAWDGGIVMISTGDETWTQIHPVGAYPYTIIDNPASPFSPGTPCYSGTTGWTQATFDLSAYPGVVQIMFRFGSDGAVNQEGWYIDDIAVVGPSTWYVATTGSDATGDGSSGNPFATIQHAANVASDADVVSVAAGTYYENISVIKPLVIIGADKETTIIDGGGIRTTIALSGSSGTFSGFTVRNAPYSWTGLSLDGQWHCYDNRIEDNLMNGIVAAGSGPHLIERNIITGNGRGIIANAPNTVIRHNNITFNDRGIALSTAGGGEVVQNNVITENTLYGLDCGTWGVTPFAVNDYNDVWGNATDYYNCSPGANSLNADPRFVGGVPFDHHLQCNSPCTDAGDPSFPNDPDGTRSDIGVYYYDHASELDADGDGVADACDLCEGFDDAVDPDGDLRPSGCDNCPNDPNPGQEDEDLDGTGDVCEEGYTQIGSGVIVVLADSLAIIFAEVTSPGMTSVTTQSSGPPPEGGYGVVPTEGEPVYYEIETTAEFSGEITVCFTYEESEVAGPEANLRLTHWEGDPLNPVDITSSLDTDANVICGVTTSLSPFALVEWVGCCVSHVGDVNDSGEDEPTIGDVAELVDHLFIDKPPLVCVAEADINQSGGVNPSQEQPGSDITIGDVADLVDYLFITGPELGVLLECL